MLVTLTAFVLPFAQYGSERFAALAFACTSVTFALFVLAVVLLAQTRRPSLVALCAVMIAGTMLASGLAVSLPLVPGSPPLYSGGAKAAAWLYIAWHAIAPLGFLAYLYLRVGRGASRTPLQRAAIIGAALLAGIALTVFIEIWTQRFPAFLTGSDLSAFRTSGVAPALILLAVVPYLLSLRIPNRSPIDRGVTVASLACGLGVIMLIAGARYSVCWYMSHICSLVVPDAILIGMLREMFAKHERAARLRIVRERDDLLAGRDAVRLEVLQRMTAAADEDDDAFLLALISEAARALRLTVQFHVTIVHAENGELVIDLHETNNAVYTGVPETGAHVPLEPTIVSGIMRRGRTMGWSDVHAAPELAVPVRTLNLPYRAFIATPFRVGSTPYALAFFSMSPLDSPFTLDDEAYVESVGALCATRLTQRHQRETMRFQTRHDTLTGLLNRSSFADEGAQLMRTSQQPALIIADIDRFRLVNDSLGHQAADMLLTEVAAALAGNARPDEVLGRLGGDTFGILVPEVGTRGELEARLCAFASEFSTTPVREVTERIPVTVSFGAATAPQDGVTFEQMFAAADSAVTAAKSDGRGRWRLYDRDAQTAARRTRQFEDELAHALAGGEFELYFQPHIEFMSGRVTGAEALIRWNHPTRGLVMPLEFIPFAEQHGLAGAIGDWVMRETVRRGVRWSRLSPGFRTWFNLSANELGDAMLLERLGAVDPADLHAVGVEITESVAMRNPQQTAEVLGAMRDAGMKVALDDFGTGYSSLAHLKRLPVDLVKIDRSFVNGVPNDTHDVAIVEAVISIASRYGFQTVAEGVETLEQVAFLSASGCTYGQGWAYAAAMPAAAFDVWFSARTAISA